MPGFLRRPTFWIVIIVVALLGGGFFYVKGQAAEKKKKLEAAAAQEEPSPYGAIAQGKADVEGGVIQVAARRQGIVREVFVQEGDIVKAGQPLAKQEDDDARLAAQTASAALASAKAQLQLYQVQLRTAQREYNRLQNLAASNFVAAQRLDAARDQIASAQANIGAQQAAISVASAQLAQAQYNQELTVIRAPADGRIARRQANPGAGASTLNASFAPRSSRPICRTWRSARRSRSSRKATRTRPMSVRSCAAPRCSAPASWPRTIPASAATNASSKWWSAPTAPRCLSASACWSSS